MKKAAKTKATAVQSPNRWLANQMRRSLAEKLDPALGAMADYQKSLHRGIQESLHLLSDLKARTERSKKTLKLLTVLIVEGTAREKNAVSALLLEESLRHIVREVIVAKPEANLSNYVFDPSLDLVLVLGGEELPSEENLAALRNSSVVKAAWLSDREGAAETELRLVQTVNHVFTQNEENLPVYRELGCVNCRCLPFAADTGIYYPKQVDRCFSSDVLLVGSVNRNALLGELLRSPALANLQVRVIGEGWDNLGGPISPGAEEEAADYYNGAKLIVNGSFSLHRAHEISACGVLQLYQEPPDRGVGLESETHWLPYRTLSEAEGLITRYMMQADERRLLATRALMANKYHHSFLQKGQELLGTIFA